MFVDELREVGVALGELGLFIGWLDVAWDGPATPQPYLCDVLHLPCPDRDAVGGALAAARLKRDAHLSTCEYCRERFVPGRLHQIDGRYVCHGCAEAKLGVCH